MEKEEQYIEKKENWPFKADLRVDFIRHGKPEYAEEERKSAKFEGNLTEEGISGIKERAMELADQINKEKELVVFWVSPKRRAQQTAEILYNFFQEKNIPVIKNLKTAKSLSDVKMSPAFIDDLSKNAAVGNWMEYWAESELPEDVEKPQEVKKRAERIVSYLERAARTVHPIGEKKLHFICVGHEEIFRDLLEEGYGLGTRDNTGPKYGEIMRMDINKSEQGKDAVLSLNYRDKYSELGFNKDNREFYRLPEK